MFLQRATRVGATARDLNRCFRVLATLAAIFLVIWHRALASGVRAFLFLSLSHGKYPFLSDPLRAPRSGAPGNRASLVNINLQQGVGVIVTPTPIGLLVVLVQ